MIPRGAAELIEMRKAGHRPAGFVFVSYGDFIDPDWWRHANTCHQPELLIRPEDPIERIDLRCLIGLDLILFFAEWSDPVSRLYERLTEYAAEIAVESPAFDSDIGWWWVRGIGRIEFADRQNLEGMRVAQAQQEYAREAVSWQP